MMAKHMVMAKQVMAKRMVMVSTWRLEDKTSGHGNG
jgi:hypothetical protein